MSDENTAPLAPRYVPTEYDVRVTALEFAIDHLKHVGHGDPLEVAEKFRAFLSEGKNV